MLKVLHGADFHLDSPFSGLKPDAAARRRGEQRELLARLTDLAREREADLVLLSGDLLDGDLVFRETVQVLARALGEIPCPVFLAPGNHDWYGPQSPYAALEWPGNVHLFTGPELGAVRLPELGCTVWGAAFCAPRQSASPLRGFHAPAEGVQLAVLHGEVAAQADYGPISEEDIAALFRAAEAIREAGDNRHAAEAAFAFQHELAMQSGNTLLPLIFRSFYSSVLVLWERFCALNGVSMLYETSVRLCRHIRHRDLFAAVAWIDYCTRETVSGSRRIYY